MKPTKKKQVLSSELIFSTLKDHTDLLKKLSVRKIGLFGSFATNSQKGRSDVDLVKV